MRPITRLVLGLGALLLIMAAAGFALPRQVTVARSVVINAPESVVFPYLDNLRTFVRWAPWAQRDPSLQTTFSGPERGKGARLEWTSDKKAVGTGNLEITESQPNRHIDLAVNVNGLEGTSAYDVLPSGSGSKVVWVFGYETSTNPIRRWRGLMLDRLVGTDLQAGLATLKERIEAERRPGAPGAEPMATAPAPEGQPSPDAQTAQPQTQQQPAPGAVPIEQRRPRRP